MQSSQCLYSLCILHMICLLTSCSADKHNPLGLSANEISYFLDSGTERVYPATCSLTEEKGRFKLTIKGALKSDGIIMTCKNIKSLSPQTLRFNREVSVIVNEKKEEDLNIYVSSGCKENHGTLEIVDWNENDKTITGIFSGPICTRGIFAHLPGTEINEGAFYKLKYNVK